MVEDDNRAGALDTPAAPDQPVVDAPATTTRPPRDPRLPWIITAIAVVVALAAVVAAVVLATGGTPEQELEDVREAAGRFALALTTWDATDGGMADTREELRAAGTEGFAGDVDELFGGTDDLATLEEIGARSTGEVRDLLVQSYDDEEAVALAVVVQRVTTDVTEGEEVSLRYALLTLRPDGGDWRVDQVELVVDALQETATRTDAAGLPGADGTDEGATDPDAAEDAP